MFFLLQITHVFYKQFSPKLDGNIVHNGNYSCEFQINLNMHIAKHKTPPNQHCLNDNGTPYTKSCGFVARFD
jgi:hypothetical protein